mmetsp:Transcript_5128/g.9693  ORF Transcript_5128/g.9693 Transcript_5128/m.9693 type:complete len:251 (-) Transcript_5128:2049-2801(-)
MPAASSAPAIMGSCCAARRSSESSMRLSSFKPCSLKSSSSTVSSSPVAPRLARSSVRNFSSLRVARCSFACWSASSWLSAPCRLLSSSRMPVSVPSSPIRLSRRDPIWSRSCCSARSSLRLNFMRSYARSNFSLSCPRSCRRFWSATGLSDVRYRVFLLFSLDSVASSARTSFSALRIFASSSSPCRWSCSRSCAALITKYAWLCSPSSSSSPLLFLLPTITSYLAASFCTRSCRSLNSSVARCMSSCTV